RQQPGDDGGEQEDDLEEQREPVDRNQVPDVAVHVREWHERYHRRGEHDERHPRQRLAAARQQHVGDEHGERADGEYKLRQDVIEVAAVDSGRHQRGFPIDGLGASPMSAPLPFDPTSGLPSASHGTEARNFAAGFCARSAGLGAPPHACAYCGLTRTTTRFTDVSSRRRNGAGYRPIQTASTISGTNVANSRWLKSSSRSFFGFSSLPNIVR